MVSIISMPVTVTPESFLGVTHLNARYVYLLVGNKPCHKMFISIAVTPTKAERCT